MDLLKLHQLEIENTSLRTTVVFQRNLLAELQKIILKYVSETPNHKRKNVTLTYSQELKFNRWQEYAMNYLHTYNINKEVYNERCFVSSFINSVFFTRKYGLKWVSTRFYVLHHVKEVSILFLDKLSECQSTISKHLLCEWMQLQLTCLGFKFCQLHLCPLNATAIIHTLFEF